MKPLVIELFAGLHGWGEGFLAEGFRVVGFDIVDMCAALGVARPAGIELVLQDVRTLHCSQFRDAACIVASPPCQAYSHRAMPWKTAKALTPEEVGLPEPAWWKLPEYRKRKDAASPCMSLQDMAEWAIWKRKHPKPPPSNELFDACFRIQRQACEAAGRYIPMVVENVKGAQPWVGSARWHFGSFFLWGDVPPLMPVTAHRKVPGMNFHEHEKTGKPGRSFQTVAVEHAKNGGDWFSGYGGGFGWDHSQMRQHNSKSPARKAASAQIAKIPFELARHIARCFKPPVEAVA